MKVKPKEIFVNLPIVLLFDDNDEIAKFAANINSLVHGKIKVKCEELGELNNQHVGIFYLNRNDEYGELRQQFVTMIDNELILEHNRSLPKKNGGVECDVESGPCACGAWHYAERKQIVEDNGWSSKEHTVMLYLLDSLTSAPEKSDDLLSIIHESHADSASAKFLSLLGRLEYASFDTAALLSTVADIREELK